MLEKQPLNLPLTAPQPHPIFLQLSHKFDTLTNRTIRISLHPPFHIFLTQIPILIPIRNIKTQYCNIFLFKILYKNIRHTVILEY